MLIQIFERKIVLYLSLSVAPNLLTKHLSLFHHYKIQLLCSVLVVIQRSKQTKNRNVEMPEIRINKSKLIKDWA